MKSRRVAAVLGVLLLGLAGTVEAQCLLEHPASAKKFSVSLVQHALGCGGLGEPVPNATVLGGVPACRPVATEDDLSGNPPGGWHFGPKGTGTLSLQVDKNKRCSTPGATPPCPAGDLNVDDPNASCTAVATPFACCTGMGSGNCGSTDCTAAGVPYACCTGVGTGTCGNVGRGDVRVTLRLKDVRDGTGAPAGDLTAVEGVLLALLRASVNDASSGGDATTIDVPATFPVPVVGGAATVKTTVNAFLNDETLHGLPKCSSLQVVSLGVSDAEGSLFASPGILIRVK